MTGTARFDGEPPGWDDRKALADVWQDHAPLPPDGLSEDVYRALIAVARWGFDRGLDQAAP
ncbi:MAG: hypothetical protein K0S43_401 [Cellulosimicrobium sp.]|nr:hypothetical protein [Cellulosimicrobium sp.]